MSNFNYIEMDTLKVSYDNDIWDLELNEFNKRGKSSTVYLTRRNRYWPAKVDCKSLRLAHPYRS